MKKVLTLFSILFVASVALCQEPGKMNNPGNDGHFHSLGDFIVSASPDILFNTPNGIQPAGSLKLKLFLGKKISFDTDLMFGRDYIHAGPGLIGIPAWLIFFGKGLSTDDESTLSGVLFVLATMVLSAEHISYNIPVSSSLDISPYLSVLRYRSSYKFGDYRNPSYAGDQFCFATGIEAIKYLGRFTLAPYTEFNMGYSDHIPGFIAGIHFGYYFQGK